MKVISLIKSLLNIQKKIDLSILPSQGLFYKDDFELSIKKATIDDIVEYEHNYNREDLGLIIYRIKRMVEKNTILSGNYTFNDIKSIDIVFLFLEIVKFTNNKQVSIKYSDGSGKEKEIDFGQESFNYFKFPENLSESYDKVNKQVVIEGFKYSLPCIGIENSITQFLLDKSYDPESSSYNNYSYDFSYFLGQKSHLSFDEIENLLQIFNFDIEDADKNKIRSIVKEISPIGKYSLKDNSQVISILFNNDGPPLTAQIDLEKIWRQ